MLLPMFSAMLTLKYIWKLQQMLQKLKITTCCNQQNWDLWTSKSSRNVRVFKLLNFDGNVIKKAFGQ